jgi:phospholipid-binding lipoprotein MlaA
MINKKTIIFYCALSILVSNANANNNFAQEEKEFLQAFGEEQVPDPYENFNRKVFAFNVAFDKAFIIPVTTVYSKVIPSWGRDRISNFVSNLQEPVSILSAILQMDKDKFANSCGRFLVNSTVGLGGLMDIASLRGLKPQYQGMEQVLAKYGGKRGDYFVFPLLGGASARHTTGILLDSLLNPLNYAVDSDVLAPITGVNYISKRSDYLDVTNYVYDEAADPYIKMRSLYWQNRYGLDQETKTK